MALEPTLLQRLVEATSVDAWGAIREKLLAINSSPLPSTGAAREIVRRDREVGELDTFLSVVGWDLWQTFTSDVPTTAQQIIHWWEQPFHAKAVLILDGLSLRELPWLLAEAKRRGFTLHTLDATASELPAETTPFAQALGFSSRSQLQNNGGGLIHSLTPAQTECVDLPWQDCAGLVSPSNNWVFWHHWPDFKIHDGAGAGQGLEALVATAAEELTSDAFWAFVERLATGRRLVITSDHGYAATGHFFDADEEQAAFLKKTFKSGRSVPGNGETGPFTPPVAMRVDGSHGPHLMAVGRWKWRSQGGYPSLTHGGLSLLEVLSPFIEITR